jgi:hypothetical protein
MVDTRPALRYTIRTMKSDSPKTQLGSKRGLAKLFLLFFLLVSLVLIANKTYLCLLIRGHLEYARAHGYPTTMDELYAFYEYPPPGENAADLYLEAFEYFVEWDQEDKRLLPFFGDVDTPPGEYMDEPTMQLVSQYLDDNHEALILLHRAALFPQCRYPIETELSYIQATNHLGDTRYGNRLLALESLYYANMRQLDLSAQTLIDSFALAHSLRQEPFFTSMCTRKACDTLNISILEDILNLTEMPKKYLSDLKDALARINYDYELNRVMIGEYVWSLNLTSFLFESGMEGDIWDRWNILWDTCIGTYDCAQIQCLNSVRECFMTLALPFPDRIRTGFSQEDLVFMNISNTSSFLDDIVNIAKSNLSNSIRINSRFEASRRVSITVLTIEQYRHDHNKLPDSLNDLVPDYLMSVLKDPYDGRDLHYKKLEKGYVVYSVGEDMTDNNGTKEDADVVAYTPGTDITFTVRR